MTLVGASTIARAVDPIVICAHAPITGASPIPHHPDRFGQFYFDAVNAEQGGIDGRPVRMITYDDQGYPAGARAAVERCMRGGASMIIGLSDPDPMVSVAKWAEWKGVPYLHGQVARADLEGFKWSGSLSPAAEAMQRALADTIADNITAFDPRDRPGIGMIRVNSPNYQAAHDAFVDSLAARGLALTVDKVIQKDENQLADLFFELQTNDVRVVNVDLPAGTFLRMMRQMPAGYDPLFTSATSALGSNLVASAMGTHRMFVLHDPGPVFDPSDDALPWAEEIDEFERIFTTYSPEQAPPPDDNDWSSYLIAKHAHRLLDSVDGDYARERIRASFKRYREEPAAAYPACAADFTVEPRVGKHSWHAFENAGGRWAQRSFCASIGTEVDLSPPSIDCGDGDVHLSDEPVRCTFSDSLAGIGAWSVDGATGSVGSGYGECVETLDVVIDPGVANLLTINVSDCAGARTTRSLLVAAILANSPPRLRALGRRSIPGPESSLADRPLATWQTFYVRVSGPQATPLSYPPPS